METKEIETKIEEKIGELYGLFYKLRENKAYQTEYDILGTLNNMFVQDRFFLRERHSSEINIYGC